jgi:DNA-binding NarL/FixJ family response regulator
MTTSSRATVLIVEDHKVVADGLRRMLSDQYEVLQIVTDGSLVVDAVSKLRPDLMLLDLSLPNLSGVEVLRQLRDRSVSFRAIVLTMHAEPTLAVEVLRAGAAGFVLKESSVEELVNAIEIVLAGGTYLATELTKDIVTYMIGSANRAGLELTARQREVLRLILRGQRAKEIASTLQMSTRAVEAIKYRIMMTLRVRSTAELVRYAIEHHVVGY